MSEYDFSEGETGIEETLFWENLSYSSRENDRRWGKGMKDGIAYVKGLSNRTRSAIQFFNFHSIQYKIVFYINVIRKQNIFNRGRRNLLLKALWHPINI